MTVPERLYPQVHFPFEDGDAEKKLSYPADYIVEAVDQTRGWFYTLLAVATLLEREAPYRNVICLGHINDKNGQKMSKSKGNAVDPWLMMEKYGVEGFPTVILVDSKGTVIAQTGYREGGAAAYVEHIKDLLAKAKK